MPDARAIGPIGTAARITVGGLVVAVAITRKGISWWDVAAVVTVLPLIATTAAVVVSAAYRRLAPGGLARSRRSDPRLAATGTVIMVFAAAATALTFVTPVNGVAIYAFIGLTMLLAAVRGHNGCELLVVPNLVLGHKVASWCPVFTPIDAAERRHLGHSPRSSPGSPSSPRPTR